MSYAPLLLLAYIAVKQPSGEAVLLLLGQLYSVVTLSIWAFDRPPEGIDHGPTHLIPLFVVMGWILTRRFVRSLNETDALNAGLEQRVAERHASLEREQAKLQALTRQQTISEERERIMTDMHDGLGAQLIATLNSVERGDTASQQVVASLRACIDDLRLAIDSLEPSEGDLLLVLGSLRYRVETRLKRLGIALDWQVGEVPKLAGLTPPTRCTCCASCRRRSRTSSSTRRRAESASARRSTRSTSRSTSATTAAASRSTRPSAPRAPRTAWRRCTLERRRSAARCS